VARRRKTAPPEAAAEPPPASLGDLAALREELHGAVQKLDDTAALLVSGLKEAPKAEDFQPLADHLYEFAQATPRLLTSLQGVQQAVEPLEDAARALEQVLVTLPRAEDYEPLVGPLREFAKVAPALAEQLAVVMKSVAPMGSAVAELKKAAAGMQPAPAPPTDTAARMAEARQAILDALATLPRDPEYRRVADHLKALASVSPSLGEWLSEVPKLSMPLGDSIASLERAAELLSNDGHDAKPRAAPPARRAAAHKPRRG
jgi:hypothetical protein